MGLIFVLLPEFYLLSLFPYSWHVFSTYVYIYFLYYPISLLILLIFDIMIGRKDLTFRRYIC